MQGMGIRTVGIVGAGQMGAGIAQIFAQAGYQVSLNDIDQEQLDTAMEKIAWGYGRLIEKGAMSAADRDAALARIAPTLELTGLGPLDLIIECATEDEAVKHKIFAALAPHLGADTILTSNTSSISITRLASATDRPERFMGFHFMNPVPLMELVELIRGIAANRCPSFPRHCSSNPFQRLPTNLIIRTPQ